VAVAASVLMPGIAMAVFVSGIAVSRAVSM